MNKVLDGLIILSLFFLSIFILCLEIKNFNYSILKIYPFIFTICYIFFLRRAILNKSLTAIFFTILSFIRFILIPYSHILANYYPLRWYSFTLKENDLYLGTFLMIYEILVISIVIYIFSKKIKKIKNREVKLEGSLKIYILLFIFSILIYALSSHKHEILNFFIIQTSNQVGRLDERIIGRDILLKRQIILAGITFLFLGVLGDTKVNKNKYLIIILGILNVCILFGERRIFQIYSFLSTIYILNYVLRKKANKIIRWIGLVGLISIVLFSIYKFLGVFNSGSYLKALEKSSFNMKEIARNLDAYYIGVFNTTINTYLKSYIDINQINNLFYDFGYSFFGLNFLLKGNSLLTSQYYNTLLYKTSSALTGQLFSAISYGYVYLGMIFSILIPIINITILLYLEKKLKLTNSLEKKYMLFYIIMRIGLSVTGITPPLISYTTMYLGTVGLVYYILLKLKKIGRVY